MGKVKSSKASTIKKHVRFTSGETSPNNAFVALAEDKNSAKVGIDVPSVGFSSTHSLYEDEIPDTFGNRDEFDAARLEAETTGEINPRTGNISGIYRNTPAITKNTKANAMTARDIKRATSSRNSSKKGKGYRKTRKTRKTKKTKKIRK